MNRRRLAEQRVRRWSARQRSHGVVFATVGSQLQGRAATDPQRSQSLNLPKRGSRPKETCHASGRPFSSCSARRLIPDKSPTLNGRLVARASPKCNRVGSGARRPLEAAHKALGTVTNATGASTAEAAAGAPAGPGRRGLPVAGLPSDGGPRAPLKPPCVHCGRGRAVRVHAGGWPRRWPQWGIREPGRPGRGRPPVGP
jgi:hypothetical protein